MGCKGAAPGRLSLGMEPGDGAWSLTPPRECRTNVAAAGRHPKPGPQSLALKAWPSKPGPQSLGPQSLGPQSLAFKDWPSKSGPRERPRERQRERSSQLRRGCCTPRLLLPRRLRPRPLWPRPLRPSLSHPTLLQQECTPRRLRKAVRPPPVDWRTHATILRYYS